MLASEPPFFKTGTTTACFIGAGNTVDDSEVLMIRANRGERASMWCFTNNVDSMSILSALCFTSEGDAGSNTSKRVLTTVGVSSAGSGDRLWHSASIVSLTLRWNLVASAECDSSATSGRGLFTFRPMSESAML